MFAKRVHQLPSAVWTAGNMQFPLRNTPAASRIRSLNFRLEADFLTGAAAALIPSLQLFRLISKIDLGPTRSGSGAYFHVLESIRRGMEVSFPASIPATNASHFLRNITWRVPFRDPRQAFPDDDEPVANSLNGIVVNVVGAPFLELDTGDNTWNTLGSITGTLYCEAELEEPNESPGAEVEFFTFDLTGQTPELDPGLYEDIFVFRENLATISSLQVATIGLQVDGLQLMDDHTRLGQHIARYNDAYALGPRTQLSSATVPEGEELLNDQPAVTAGAAATLTVPWVPVVYPLKGGKKTQLPLAQRNILIRYTGTDTTLHVGCRRIRRRTDAEKVAAMHAVGRNDISSAAQIEAKTGSKKGLVGWKAGLKDYFPLRAASSSVK